MARVRGVFVEARLEIVERRLNSSEVLAISNSRIYDIAGWQAVRSCAKNPVLAGT